MKLVLVTWRDPYATLEQGDGKDLKPHCLCRTVGYLLSEDGPSLTLAWEKVGDDDYRGFTVIPKCLVKKRKVLQKK